MVVECVQTKTQAALEEYLHYQFPYQYPLRFGQLVLRLLGPKQVTRDIFSRIILPPDLRSQKSVDSILSELLTSDSAANANIFKPLTKTPSSDDRYHRISHLDEKPGVWVPSFSSPKQDSPPDFATHFQALQRELDPRRAWCLPRLIDNHPRVKPEMHNQMPHMPNGAFNPVTSRMNSFNTYYQFLQNQLSNLSSSNQT